MKKSEQPPKKPLRYRQVDNAKEALAMAIIEALRHATRENDKPAAEKLNAALYTVNRLELP